MPRRQGGGRARRRDRARSPPRINQRVLRNRAAQNLREQRPERRQANVARGRANRVNEARAVAEREHPAGNIPGAENLREQRPERRQANIATGRANEAQAVAEQEHLACNIPGAEQEHPAGDIHALQREHPAERDPERQRGRKRPSEELEDLVDDTITNTEADVWCLGDSIMYWAGNRAAGTSKPTLKLNTTIAWLGVRGLHWHDFRHTVEYQVLFCNSPPKIIFIHLGGNDLSSLSILDIKDYIKKELSYMRDAFPDAVIIWVDILQRRIWKVATGGWVGIEQKRKRVNRIGRQLLKDVGNVDVIRTDIDAKTNFFRKDGVHLNDIGLEFFLYEIKQAIIKHL
ncbi:uncharacterized protein LOC128557327 [Mercenaria mercenaria]|uniref:uncharacterized protein LOC128557327 n=1 Tax=Mercenaria mercenaria TaxID=6596 RepID=UPI00234F20DA|nr:uncharacterized protein LOC128557327 [Mercenaria mercenaria]